MEYLKAQKEIIDDVLVLGLGEAKDRLDKELKKIETNEKEKNEQERF